MKKVLFWILAFILTGEAVCRVWNAYDAGKRYQRLLLETRVIRDQVYSIAKPADTKRVFLLGGSAAYDTIDDYRKSWPYKLQQILQEHSKNPIEVLNFGFYSESSIDEVSKLDAMLDMQPDLVVVFDGFNDVYNLWHHYDYHKRLYEVKAKPLLFEKEKRFFLLQLIYDVCKKVRDESALISRLRQFESWIKRRLSLPALARKQRENREKIAEVPEDSNAASSAPRSEPSEPEKPKDLFDGVGKGPSMEQFFENPSRWPEIEKGYLEIYGSNLNKIARMTAEKARAKGIFIFQPDLSYKPRLTSEVSENEREEFLSGIARHGETWLEIQKIAYPKGLKVSEETARKYGFVFDDFNRRILLRGDVSGLFKGNVHFSDEGREVIAREVAGLILEKKLLG